MKNEDEANESNKQEENVKTLAHSLSQEDKILKVKDTTSNKRASLEANKLKDAKIDINIKEPEQKESDSLNMPKHHAQENNNTISETSCNINDEVKEKAETSCQSEPQPGSMLTESVNEEKTDHIKKDDAIKQLSNSKSEADESIISPEKPIQNDTEIEMKENKVSPSEKTPEDNEDMEKDKSPTQIATLENKGEGKPSNLELEEKMPKNIDSKTPPIVDIKKIPELDKEKEFSKENAKKAEQEINEKMIYDTVESNEKAEVTIEKKETPQESLITNEMQVLEQKEVAKKKIDSDADVEDQKTSKKLDVETKTKEQIESSTKEKKVKMVKKKKKKSKSDSNDEIKFDELVSEPEKVSYTVEEPDTVKEVPVMQSTVEITDVETSEQKEDLPEEVKSNDNLPIIKELSDDNITNDSLESSSTLQNKSSAKETSMTQEASPSSSNVEKPKNIETVEKQIQELNEECRDAKISTKGEKPLDEFVPIKDITVSETTKVSEEESLEASKTVQNLQEDSLLEKEEKILEDSGKTQNDTNKPKKEEKIIVDTEKVQNNSNDASVNESVDDAPRKQEGIKHMSFSAVGEVVTGC